MWWSPLQRPRPTLRPDGGCTHVELDEPLTPGQTWAAPEPRVRDDGLRSAALLAAHVHADGPPVGGAIAAAAVLHRLTSPGDPRRFQAWLLQGLYHRLAGAEAHRTRRDEAVVRAHMARARSVLRLAATSPDPLIRRRANVALGRLVAGAVAGAHG